VTYETALSTAATAWFRLSSNGFSRRRQEMAAQTKVAVREKVMLARHIRKLGVELLKLLDHALVVSPCEPFRLAILTNSRSCPSPGADMA
jgi:hypothetical protein